eukprot:scaffold2299_cov131-Cylindrotheca_fusiformis.AAC.28
MMKPFKKGFAPWLGTSRRNAGLTTCRQGSQSSGHSCISSKFSSSCFRQDPTFKELTYILRGGIDGMHKLRTLVFKWPYPYFGDRLEIDEQPSVMKRYQAETSSRRQAETKRRRGQVCCSALVR